MGGTIRRALSRMNRSDSASDYVLAFAVTWVVVLGGGVLLDADLGDLVRALVAGTIGGSIGATLRLRSQRRKRQKAVESKHAFKPRT